MNEDNVYRLYLPLPFRIMLIYILVLFLGVSIFMTILPSIFKDSSGPPHFTGIIGIFWFVILAGNLFWILRIPHKIILHRDGSIEFISVTRKLKIHAMEIKSISPEGTMHGFLVVRTDKKIRILAQFDNFHDFVLRLKALNPSILFRGC